MLKIERTNSSTTTRGGYTIEYSPCTYADGLDESGQMIMQDGFRCAMLYFKGYGRTKFQAMLKLARWIIKDEELELYKGNWIGPVGY